MARVIALQYDQWYDRRNKVHFNPGKKKFEDGRELRVGIADVDDPDLIAYYLSRPHQFEVLEVKHRNGRTTQTAVEPPPDHKPYGPQQNRAPRGSRKAASS